MKLICTGAIAAPTLPLWAANFDNLRGDRVGWARLKTPGEHWMRHATGDPTLMRFLREQTTLNIDPTWYVADVQSLDQMCGYPLLFSQSLVVIKETSARTHLVEYMKRGGFMLVDACCNLNVTPDHDAFLAEHVAFLKEVLPAAKVVLLPPEHEVYRCRFQMPAGHPPHSFFRNEFDARKARHGLYGIMLGERMVGIISLSGLQCGWSPMGVTPPPGQLEACMKMLVNIYIYAMTQGD